MNHHQYAQLLLFLSNKKYIWAKFQGISMEPFLSEQQIEAVLIQKCSFYSKGDIVAYVHPTEKTLIMHRIIAISELLYRVKGDNNWWCDGFLHDFQIIGKLVAIKCRNQKIYQVQTLPLVAEISNLEQIIVSKFKIPGKYLHKVVYRFYLFLGRERR